MRSWLEKSTRVAELVLVAAVFFGIGAYVQEQSAHRNNPISVTEPDGGYAAAVAAYSASERAYVASRYGTVYYAATCANNIKEENKIYFGNKEDAEKAGLKPAENCVE